MMPTTILDGAVHHIIDHHDTSPPYNNGPIYLGGNPDHRRCACCFLGFSHSQAKHAARVERFERDQREYAGRLAASADSLRPHPTHPIHIFLLERGWRYTLDRGTWSLAAQHEDVDTKTALELVAAGNG